MFDLLQEIPSLYELHLDFFAFIEIEDEILEDYMRKISGLTGIRKLKMVFNFNESNFSAKQGGNILCQIFNKMPFLEELDLRLPKNCLDFVAESSEENIQGLPRLKKVFISLRECEVQAEKSIWAVIEILGRCRQLRELELDLTKSIHDSQETTRRLCDCLIRLQKLQVFHLHTNELLVSKGEESAIGLILDFIKTFDRMRSLQDFHLDVDLWPLRGGRLESFYELKRQIENSKKYRFFHLGFYY